MTDPIDATHADVEANALFTSLITGSNLGVAIGDVSGYTAPAATGPLYASLPALVNADLTTQTLDGTGTFDVLMGGLKAVLQGEFAANRISGAEYTKAFIAVAEAAVQGSVQYLLGRDQAYWQSVQAQSSAQLAQVALVTAKVTLEVTKAQLASIAAQAAAAQAEFALTKAKLATEAASYRNAEFTYSNMLPMQLNLLSEQREAQRAQTQDTRSDGSTVVGSVGMQKSLYAQQITSYKRDAEVKAAKLFTDAWITQKTMDSGLTPPSGFTNATIDGILSVLVANNAL